MYVYSYLSNTPFSLTSGALHGSFGMDCLVVVGTTVTFIYSCVQLSLACNTGEPTKHVFFEASGMLLMFVTFGKYLEAYAKGKTVSAITNLLSMQPSHALLVVSTGSMSVIDSPNGVGAMVLALLKDTVILILLLQCQYPPFHTFHLRYHPHSCPYEGTEQYHPQPQAQGSAELHIQQK